MGPTTGATLTISVPKSKFQLKFYLIEEGEPELNVDLGDDMGVEMEIHHGTEKATLYNIKISIKQKTEIQLTSAPSQYIFYPKTTNNRLAFFLGGLGGSEIDWIQSDLM